MSFGGISYDPVMSSYRYQFETSAPAYVNRQSLKTLGIGAKKKKKNSSSKFCRRITDLMTKIALGCNEDTLNTKSNIKLILSATDYIRELSQVLYSSDESESSSSDENGHFSEDLQTELEGCLSSFQKMGFAETSFQATLYEAMPLIR